MTRCASVIDGLGLRTCHSIQAERWLFVSLISNGMGLHCHKAAFADLRFMEFFAANIRNPHARRGYARETKDIRLWCGDVGGAQSIA